MVIYFVPSRTQVSRCHSLQNLDTDFNHETELTIKSKKHKTLNSKTTTHEQDNVNEHNQSKEAKYS